VGPTSEGLFPEPSVQRLAEIGRWMKVHHEAIYGTSASPFKHLPWGRCTQKAAQDGTTRLYLHVFEWPADGNLLVPGLTNTVDSATVLGSEAAVRFAQTPEGVALTLPRVAPDALSSTVLLKIQGRP